MVPKHRFHTIGIVVIMAFQLYARPALAQQDTVRELEGVVVSDRHAELRKKEESLNVEIVGDGFIRRHLGGSLMTTLSRLPGIKTIGIGSGQSKPLIRGMGFNRVVVIDKGIKHQGQQWGADHGLELDQFAAGEVEIIKGAASFIYGSDAIGGVINVKAPSPPLQHTLGGAIDLVAKSNNRLYGTSLNLYGRSARWFFDSRLTLQNYADYRVPADTVYVYDYGVELHNRRLRNTAGRETGLHLHTGFLDDRFSSVFHISNVYSRSGFFANAHGLEPRRVDAEMHDGSARDLLLPSQEVSHFKVINRSRYWFKGHSLQMELGYQENFRQEFSGYVNHGYMPPVYPDSMLIPFDLERQFDKKIYSANLRGLFALGWHELTIGLNGEYQDNGIGGWGFLIPAFRQRSAGVFVYDKLKLSEKILLHGALRYDHGHMQVSGYSDWFPSGEAPGTAFLVRAEDLTRTFNSLVWSAGLNYHPGNGFSLKANIGKSFRMPIAKELAANGVNYHYFSYERGNPSLSPEQSYQADLTLGYKAERWSVQLSPFYNYFPNYIYLNPTAGHDFFYGAGNQVFAYEESRVMRYGGELRLRHQLSGSLSAEALGEYLYSRQLSGDKEGYTLPFSPPPSLLLNLTWSPGISPSLQGTYISLDYRITARQHRIVPPERKTSGYRLLNLQAGARVRVFDHPVTVSLQARNLLNTRYLNHTSFYRLIQLPEAGRNIILALKVPIPIHSTNFKNK